METPPEIPTPPQIPMERRLIKLGEIDSKSLNARWPKKLAEVEHPDGHPDLFSETLEEDFPSLITDEWISFNDLVQSVRETGLLQDPHVMELPEPDSEGKKYRLLYGFRRTRAFWAASGGDLEAELWVMVHPLLGESTIRLLQLTENYHRQNMSFVSDLEAVRALRDTDKLVEREIASKLGISNGKAHSYVVLGRLIKKYETLETMVASGALGYNHLAEIEKTLREVAGEYHESLGANRHAFIDDRLRDVVEFFAENIDQVFQEHNGNPPRGAIRTQLSHIKKRLKSPEAAQHVKDAITWRQGLLDLDEPGAEDIMAEGGFDDEHLKLAELPEPPKPTADELRSRRVRTWSNLTDALRDEDWSLLSLADRTLVRMAITALDQKMTLLTNPTNLMDVLDQDAQD